jgi:hypothetical protein
LSKGPEKDEQQREESDIQSAGDQDLEEPLMDPMPKPSAGHARVTRVDAGGG